MGVKRGGSMGVEGGGGGGPPSTSGVIFGDSEGVAMVEPENETIYSLKAGAGSSA